MANLFKWWVKFSGVRRILHWGVSMTSHRDDVRMLQFVCFINSYGSSEGLRYIGLRCL